MNGRIREGETVNERIRGNKIVNGHIRRDGIVCSLRVNISNNTLTFLHSILKSVVVKSLHISNNHYF